jgi:hypothetical protein
MAICRRGVQLYECIDHRAFNLFLAAVVRYKQTNEVLYKLRQLGEKHGVIEIRTNITLNGSTDLVLQPAIEGKIANDLFHFQMW